MIASGARRVVEVGLELCGGLLSSLKAGDIIFADEALVDEGTSSQYHTNPTRFRATTNLRRRLEQVLEPNLELGAFGLPMHHIGRLARSCLALAEGEQLRSTWNHPPSSPSANIDTSRSLPCK